MPGRGPLTFKKKQREQLQKEKQAEKLVRRLERNRNPPQSEDDAAGVQDEGAGAPDSDDQSSS